MQELESLGTHLTDLQFSAKTTGSQLGYIDMSEVVIKLQSLQNMMQLSFATFARIIDQNLLDFLS